MAGLLTLLLFLFPLAWSPGPGNLFFAATGARFGMRATLPASAGYHAATWVMSLCLGLGFIGLAGSAPWAPRAVQIAGAAFVLWLAWKTYRAGMPGAAHGARAVGPLGGAMLLLLNPKAYLIMGLLFAQFLPEQGADIVAVFWIATVFTLNNLVAFTCWTMAGAQAARHLRGEGAARVVNTGFALMLAAVALWMLLA